ncbi:MULTISPECIES: hypothetical protein [unclassified Thermoplasma]|uniref:hypothetical protein n=1 Tax=unclassified Thermoplasma TaxID=2684908 RepID=UPI000D893906|nr:MULTISPECIES: hypothetical protein [unclassified Thermoplasma]PYB68982.1 hypothetical protein DMB44_01135 [Thermoplasma sp. Kam2015]
MAKIEIDDALYSELSAMGDVEDVVREAIKRYTKVPSVYAVEMSAYDRYISSYFCHGNAD